jgi:hypothetical protein
MIHFLLNDSPSRIFSGGVFYWNHGHIAHLAITKKLTSGIFADKD